jgi:NAD-dependent SIR2 family protein deacetylase
MKDTTAHLHIICQDWARTLQFYKSEIPFFKKRLEEIATKNTGEDVRKQVEHFENEFKIMNNNIDELLHDVNLKQDALMKGAMEKPNFINVKMIETDADLEALIDFTEIEFAKTKKDFYRFLSNNL